MEGIDNNESFYFIDSPYYSTMDENLNDKAFHELRPGERKNMRTFLINKKCRDKTK